MQIEILGTGSDGNCFLFDKKIMIDAGLPYSKIKDHVKDVYACLLTHIHGDHFKADTIRKLYINNENIKFVCGEFLHEALLDAAIPHANIVIVDNNIYKIGSYLIAAVELYHDVPNFGWRIVDINSEHSHFHATDTAHLEGIEAVEYDTATIECNHDIHKAKELIAQAKENGEFTHLKGAINSHLSVQQATEFVRENRIKKLIPVHIGNSTKEEVAVVLVEEGLL